LDQVLTKRADQFSETAIDDEIVVMSLDSGDFFSLTGTARTIWQLIDGTRDRAALLVALADQYDCTEAEIAGDLDGFVAQLSQAGLIGAA
jgi:hypothetical protein